MSIAMQRSITRSSGSSSCRSPLPVCRAVRRVGRVVSASRPLPHRFASQFAARATEEATAAESVSTEDESAPPAADATAAATASEDIDSIGLVERARRALEAEAIDRPSLEAAVNEIEAELGRLQDASSFAAARVASLEATAATAKDQLIRLNADFENFRRRTREEKEKLADSLRGDIVTSLLPVIDNFELARTQVKAETEGEEKIHGSYQALYRQFVEFLRGLGVESVPSVGSIFDPNFHEAIMKEANNEVPDETVLMEFRKGFKIGDKLLRPAMVKVSMNDGTGPAPAPAPEPAAEE